MIKKYEIKGSLRGGLHVHNATTTEQPLFYHVILTLSDERITQMLASACRNPSEFLDDELLELIREKSGDANAKMPLDPVAEYPEEVIAAMLQCQIPWPTSMDFREAISGMKTIAEKHESKVDETEMFAFSCRPITD